jgi:integrase
MPSGGAVIEYKGVRGTVWRVKYTGADGRQVQETIGSEAKGWTERKARAELRARETDVRRDGLRKLDPVSFRSFSAEWIDEYPDAQALKRSTRAGYRSIIENHLQPAFERLKLEQIDTKKVQEYVTSKRRAGLAPRTINRHLNLLHKLLDTALRRQLIRTNPVASVERPREPRTRWTILTPEKIGKIEAAFWAMIGEAETEDDRSWLEQARVVFMVLVQCGLRRGELLGLRWRNVHLADPDGAWLRVIDTIVLGAPDTPKSEAGERTLGLEEPLPSELFEHRGRSAFDGDDDRVFCHPLTGGTLDHKAWAKTFRLAIKRAELDLKLRPFHDVRHTAITNAAAAGVQATELMAWAGHSDFATTKRYIDLAGETFRNVSKRLSERVWGETGTNSRYKNGGLSPDLETETAALHD